MTHIDSLLCKELVRRNMLSDTPIQFLLAIHQNCVKVTKLPDGGFA